MSKMDEILKKDLEGAETKEAIEIVKNKADRYGLDSIVTSAKAKLEGLTQQAVKAGGDSEKVDAMTAVDAEISKVEADTVSRIREVKEEPVEPPPIVFNPTAFRARAEWNKTHPDQQIGQEEILKDARKRGYIKDTQEAQPVTEEQQADVKWENAIQNGLDRDFGTEFDAGEVDALRNYVESKYGSGVELSESVATEKFSRLGGTFIPVEGTDFVFHFYKKRDNIPGASLLKLKDVQLEEWKKLEKEIIENSKEAGTKTPQETQPVAGETEQIKGKVKNLHSQIILMNQWLDLYYQEIRSAKGSMPELIRQREEVGKKLGLLEHEVADDNNLKNFEKVQKLRTELTMEMAGLVNSEKSFNLKNQLNLVEEWFDLDKEVDQLRRSDLKPREIDGRRAELNLRNKEIGEKLGLSEKETSFDFLPNRDHFYDLRTELITEIAQEAQPVTPEKTEEEKAKETYLENKGNIVKAHELLSGALRSFKWTEADSKKLKKLVGYEIEAKPNYLPNSTMSEIMSRLTLDLAELGKNNGDTYIFDTLEKQKELEQGEHVMVSISEVKVGDVYANANGKSLSGEKYIKITDIEPPKADSPNYRTIRGYLDSGAYVSTFVSTSDSNKKNIEVIRK